MMILMMMAGRPDDDQTDDEQKQRHKQRRSSGRVEQRRSNASSMICVTSRTVLLVIAVIAHQYECVSARTAGQESASHPSGAKGTIDPRVITYPGELARFFSRQMRRANDCHISITMMISLFFPFY